MNTVVENTRPIALTSVSSKIQESIAVKWINELNLKKFKEMIIDFRRNKTIIPPIVIDGQQLERVTAYKLLGLWVEDDLKWKSNVKYLVKKAAKRLFCLNILKSYNTPVQDLKLFFTPVVRSILGYCAQVWLGNLPKDRSRDLERIQKRAVRINFPELTYDEALLKCNLVTLESRREEMCLKLVENLCMIQIINYIVYCQTRSRTLQIELQERVVKECIILNAEQNDIRAVQILCN